MLKKFFVFLSIIFLGFNFKIFGISKSQDNIYQIQTQEDLYEFAKLVNSGKSNVSAILINNIVINKNIKLTDKETEREKKYLDWEPIGKYSGDNKGFSGVFDGNNHSISGIYCDTENNAGLFGWLDLSGEIKNLKIKNSYFLSDFKNNLNDDLISCGVVCASSFGTIKNCKSENNIIISRSSDENTFKSSGGICGWNGGSIVDCRVYKTRVFSKGKGENNSGGISGIIKGEIINCVCSKSNISSKDGNINNSGGTCAQSLTSGNIDKCEVNKNTKIISEGNYINNCSGGIIGENFGTVYKSKVKKIKVVASGQSEKNISSGICGMNSGFLDSCAVSSVKLISKDGKLNYKAQICAYSKGKEVNSKYDDDLMSKILISIRNSIFKSK